MKSKFTFVFIIILAIICSSCGSNVSNEVDVAIAVSLTQTATAPQVEQPAASTAEEPVSDEPGILKGTVQWTSLQTSAVIVYALDPETGQWATMQIDADNPTQPFELYVDAGSYMVFAFTEDGNTYLGYPNTDDSDLALIEIANGEIIENLNIRPPREWNCGIMWGVPGSPDGTYGGFMASENCINTAWAEGDYIVPSSDLCQMLEGVAQETLGVPFVLNMNDIFVDNIAGESGTGCSIQTQVTENQLSTQNGVVEDLKNAFVGWEEDAMYMADGPTGSATALRRDMALMLLSATWEPVAGVDCPDDQPIAACELTPEQKLYTIEIEIGMK
jgi:hypothetical protein